MNTQEYYAIRKFINQGLKQRMIVKRFKDSNALHGFLNAQYDNKWKDISELNESFKAGTYVFAGGKYQNVKSVDPSALAHC